MKFKMTICSLLVSSSFALLQGAAIANPFSLRSPQLSSGEILPESMVFQGFGCSGGNQSPALAWENVPDGTKSFAITIFDPDAPTGVGWWHWLVFNLPADVRSLPQGAGTTGNNQLPGTSEQGYTDYGTNGYGGACPPVGDIPHRYIITVHALDIATLPTGAETTGAKLSFLLRNHSLGAAKLVGYYSR